MNFTEQIVSLTKSLVRPIANKGRATTTKPSKQQCDMAGAVFGVSDPNVQKVCGSAFDKQIAKGSEKAVEVSRAITAFFQGERSKEIEAEGRKADLVSRYPNWPVASPKAKPTTTNWVGGVSAMPKNREPESESWTDIAQQTAKPIPKPQSSNYYSRHDLREGKLRF